MSLNQSSIDENEVKKFSDIASEWWNEEGSFRSLHIINPVRIKYIRDKIIDHFNINKVNHPLSDIKILDVGCGGGLLSAPLSRIGANVVGIDVSYNNIEVANVYKNKHQLPNLEFRLQSVEDVVDEKFDVVLVMEVVEHVNDIHSFLKSCIKVLNKRGLIFISTINKTLKSYLFAIVCAEYILKILPKKTHSWNKFLKPSIVNQVLEGNYVKTNDLIGLSYNPIFSQCSLTSDISVNYMIYGTKV